MIIFHGKSLIQDINEFGWSASNALIKSCIIYNKNQLDMWDGSDLIFVIFLPI